MLRPILVGFVEDNPTTEGEGEAEGQGIGGR